jgi:hypothetical protein
MNLGDAVFVVALALIAGMNVYYARRIKTDRIPMHFIGDEVAMWFMPKLAGLWFSLFFLIVCRLLIVAAQASMPAYVHPLDITVLLLALAGVYGHFVHMRASVRWAARKQVP